LLEAISDEAERLVTHDDGGFMSRVAYLAPAPQTGSSGDKDGNNDEKKDRPVSTRPKQT
jgi:hypothetical protein